MADEIRLSLHSYTKDADRKHQDNENRMPSFHLWHSYAVSSYKKRIWSSPTGHTPCSEETRLALGPLTQQTVTHPPEKSTKRKWTDEENTFIIEQAASSKCTAICFGMTVPKDSKKNYQLHVQENRPDFSTKRFDQEPVIQGMYSAEGGGESNQTQTMDASLSVPPERVMSDGSNHNDDEAGRGEDRLHFPTQESGDTRPTDDHFRSFVDQETYFNRTGETQPHNSPPGVFYSIRLPPSQTANSGYHSIRLPNNAIHFRNYRPHHYSDRPNGCGGGAAAADEDDFGHSDLSESQLGSYDAGMLNLGVSLRHGNRLDIPVLHENVPHLGVNDELYAIGPASLPSGDDSDELDQTVRKSICSVVSEGQEAMDEEGDIEQTSLVSVNPPTVESTVSQRNGEENAVIFENVTETVPGLAASTSGYQTGTDAEPGRVQPVDNFQTLVKGDNQEPTQHPEQHLQQHLQPGPEDDLQVRPPLSPALVLVSRMALHAHRNQEGQPGEEMDEESDVNN